VTNICHPTPYEHFNDSDKTFKANPKIKKREKKIKILEVIVIIG